MADISAALRTILENSPKLVSPRAWRLIFKQIKQSLSLQSAGVLTLSGLFAAGADFAELYASIYWVVLSLALLAVIVVSIMMVTRPRPRKQRDLLAHIYLASFGAALTSVILVNFAPGNDSQKLASIDETTGQIADTTRNIEDNTRDIAATTREIADAARLENVTRLEERLAERLGFSIKEDEKKAGQYTGKITWPRNMDINPRKCEFENQESAIMTLKAKNCTAFTATLSDNVNLSDHTIWSGLSSGDIPWLIVETKDKKSLSIPAYNLYTEMVQQLSAKQVSAMNEARNEARRQKKASITFEKQRNNTVIAIGLADGDENKKGRCQWYSNPSWLKSKPIEGKTCRAELELTSNPDIHRIKNKDISVTLYGELSNMVGSVSQEIPEDILEALSQQRDKAFETVEGIINVVSLDVDRIGYNQSDFNLVISASDKNAGALITLATVTAAIPAETGDGLTQGGISFDGKSGQNLTLLGGSTLSGNMRTQTPPGAVAICSIAGVNNIYTLSLSAWKLEGKGFREVYDKSFPIDATVATRGTHDASVLTCKPQSWPWEIGALLVENKSPPTQYTRETYRSKLITSCINAAASAEATAFCIENGKSDFSSFNLASNIYGLFKGNLTCQTMHRLYLEVVDALSRNVSLPAIDAPPSCAVYSQAVELLLDGLEKEKPANGRHDLVFEPFDTHSKNCNDAGKDGLKRLEACAVMFGGGTWLDYQRKNCERYSAERGLASLQGSVSGHLSGLATAFGDAALKGRQSSAVSPFQHGLESDAFAWYSQYLTNASCEAVTGIAQTPEAPAEQTESVRRGR